MASADQEGTRRKDGGAPRATHRPLQLANNRSVRTSGGSSSLPPRASRSASAGQRQTPSFRRSTGQASRHPSNGHRRSRSAGQRSTPRGRTTHVNRARFGYPTMSERLAKGSPQRGFGKRGVIGSTVQHNGSLGYIRRGPFRGNARQRAIELQIVHILPYALGAVAVVLALFGVGTVAQGGWNPFAALGGGNPEGPSVLSRTVANSMGVPPGQAILQVQSPGVQVLGAGSMTASGNGRVTFSAVGDNIANENLLELADAASGELGDDQYDFHSFYDGIRDVVRSYDIAFINQETTLGGPDRYGYNGYPSFNTPDSMADAIVDAGWDVVSINSNHTYDTGEPSIQHGLEVWRSKASDLMAIGSYATDEERNRVQLVERNGVRIAFLSYCYGQNGYEQSDLPNDFYSVPYVREDMQADVTRAREVADAVVVYMHWGTEYEHEPDETQRAWAQELADAGVDLVIGSHAHVIQPMEWLEGAGGRTLVVYGLGDVWSGYDSYPECVLSGMFTCEFVRLGADEAAEAGRSVSIENIVWRPLIEHMENGVDTVYLVSDYSAEKANANELLGDVEGDRYTWMCDLTHKIIGEEFTIDL